MIPQETDARVGSPVGRLQWSKNGVTIYNPDGGFIARMEHPQDIALMNRFMRDALKFISEQQQARKDAAKSAPVTNPVNAPIAAEVVE